MTAALFEQIEQTAEIGLSADVLAAICRRGRLHLRNIQSSSQATLKLDRFRGVLEVTGSKGAIADVHTQLECLTGPFLSVSASVWAELMRTRTNPDVSLAAVARLQEQSGCRIHIERSLPQIRLFGPKDKTGIAQRLLNLLESMCVEEAVEMKCPQYLDLQMLQTFAEEFGVTLQVEEKQIVVLGIDGAVKEASRELRNYESDSLHFEQGLEVVKSSDVARLAIEASMSKLRNPRCPSSASTSADSLPAFVEDNCDQPTESQLQGAVISALPKIPARQQCGKAQDTIKQGYLAESTTSCRTCGVSVANFCVHCGQPSVKVVQPACGACPDCRVAKFCVSCGKATATMNTGNKATVNSGNITTMSMTATTAMPCNKEDAANVDHQIHHPMMPTQFFRPGVCGGDTMWAPEAMTMWAPVPATMWGTTMYASYQQGFPGVVPFQQGIAPTPQGLPLLQLAYPSDTSTTGWHAGSPGTSPRGD